MRRIKRWGASRDGCEVCGCGDVGRLVFKHVGGPREGSFSVSNAPYMAGMTLERLKEEIRKTRLVCRGCAKGWLWRRGEFERLAERGVGLEEGEGRGVPRIKWDLREHEPRIVLINNKYYRRMEEGERGLESPEEPRGPHTPYDMSNILDDSNIEEV